ncbi:hypothetical protein GPZ77_16460 [Streptomyces sp. QHH-9511]|uniref:hypothetical protein n=1 Tax=Streptomyces sp. QHH-9511 TaxID=2684468 RepID=UPI0013167770|nr:hypothetical protein [Streptomyces sp. QHH-9511]QGZ49755.1 hypothetical protein GPZ77_16460 [Streptomyces sp. QHH-9511]
METLILIAAIIVMTALGMWLIHRLNSQHDARIAAFRFGDALPGVGRRPGRRPRTPGGSAR